MADLSAQPQTQQSTLSEKANGAAAAVVNSTQSAMNSISNSQTVQSLQNGPVAEKARTELNATSNEFSNLANSRQTPQHTAATGQNLTHYHSFFYNLLSWENPRVTAISYAAIVAFIFATRYVPLVRYGLRLTWITLGVTAAAESVGHLVLGQGVVSKMRPKRYYTIPRETLESALEDVEQLINFFVIEVQRVVFAENVFTTIAAFLTAFATYFLVKIMPTWGLTLLFATAAYFVPLVYISNRELIDGQIESASNLISQQTGQIRDLASHHTNVAVEKSSAAFKDYSNKAIDTINATKQAAVDKGYVAQETADKITPASSTPAVTAPHVTNDSFPTPPSQEPVSTLPSEIKTEPVPAL